MEKNITRQLLVDSKFNGQSRKSVIKKNRYSLERQQGGSFTTNTEETKVLFVSHHQNAGQNRDIKIFNETF